MLERILNPISDVEELNKRIHRIEIVSTIKTKKGVEHCLKQISDLPRIHHKFTNYTINAQDILSLDQSYTRLLAIPDDIALCLVHFLLQISFAEYNGTGNFHAHSHLLKMETTQVIWPILLSVDYNIAQIAE